MTRDYLTDRDEEGGNRKNRESEIPARRTDSVYADIVADFTAQGTESMQATVAGMKPATLRAGLRRALKGGENEGVKLAQRGEETYLVRPLTR